MVVEVVVVVVVSRRKGRAVTWDFCGGDKQIEKEKFELGFTSPDVGECNRRAERIDLRDR